MTASAGTAGGSEVETSITITASKDAKPGTARANLHGESGALSATRDLGLILRGLPGALDRSFGEGGTLQISPTVAELGAYSISDSVVVDGSHSLVIFNLPSTGPAPWPQKLARFDTTTRKLDTTFATGAALAVYSEGHTALQPDGRILHAANGDGRKVVVRRYLPTGAIDASFGDGGAVTVPFVRERNELAGLTVQADGRILLGASFSGVADLAGVNQFAEVARLMPDGTVDSTFGTNGVFGGAPCRTEAFARGYRSTE